MSGNSYTNWAKITPRHQAFLDAILQSPCHMITTVRRKTDYELVDVNGKKVPQKVGLKEVTREGFEYELTCNLELDTKHSATVSKDRTGLFDANIPFMPSEETGRMILEWCNSGVVLPEITLEQKIQRCNTIESLSMLFAAQTDLSDDMKQIFSNRKNEINAHK
jgi:hypothetical protein